MTRQIDRERAKTWLKVKNPKSPAMFWIVDRMNKVWTSDDVRTLRTELLATRDLREVADVLDRPVNEVEEMARELGWIEAPPIAPDE
jgi:hypothetical protein